MKDYKPFIVIGVVLAATIGIIAYAMSDKGEIFNKPASNTTSAPPLTLPAHARGNLQANVILEEFGDYQCPSCGLLAPVLKKIEEDYKGQVRFQFSHFPIPSHSLEMLAAKASEAAGKQGKFWEMHDKLYDKQQEWGKLEKDNKSVKTEAEARSLIEQYAGELNLNMGQFKADWDSPDTEKQIVSDKRRALALNVAGTPTLFMWNTQNPDYSRPQMLKPEVMAEPGGAGIRKALDFLITGKQSSLATPPANAPAPGGAAPGKPNGKQ